MEIWGLISEITLLFDGGLNYIKSNKHSFRITFSLKATYAKNLKEPYKNGFAGGNASPPDQFYSYQLLYGRIITLNPKETIRFNLQGGIGYRRSQIAVNFQNHNYYTTFGYHSTNSLEFIINPRLEFPFSRGYGLSLSPLIIIGKDKTFVGVGIEQIFGILKKGKTSKSSY